MTRERARYVRFELPVHVTEPSPHSIGIERARAPAVMMDYKVELSIACDDDRPFFRSHIRVPVQIGYEGLVDAVRIFVTDTIRGMVEHE